MNHLTSLKSDRDKTKIRNVNAQKTNKVHNKILLR